MKKILPIIIAGLFTVGAYCNTPLPAKAQWTSLGGVVNINATDNGDFPDVAILDNTQYISYVGTTGTGSAENIYAVEWDGTTWSLLGSSLNTVNTASAYSPSISMSGDISVVAWSELINNTYTIYAKARSLDQWNLLGDINVPINQDKTNHAINPSVAIAAAKPYITWSEYDGTSYKVYVKSWTTPAWLPVGTSYLNEGDEAVFDAMDPMIKMAATTPYVTWVEKIVIGSTITAKNQIYCKKWEGNTWRKVGRSSINRLATQHANEPSMTIHNNQPAIAWSEYTGENWQVFVKLWNGSGWQSLGSGLNIDSIQDASQPHLASNGEFLAIAWREQGTNATQIYSKYWNGEIWKRLGNESLNLAQNQNAQYPKMVFDGNIPQVSWSEDTPTGTKIFMKQYTATLEQAVPEIRENRLRALRSKFNPSANEYTVIQWYLEKTEDVSITIYNFEAEKIKTLVSNQSYTAGGPHQINWDGKNEQGSMVASGVYLALIEAGGFKKYVKIVVVKK